MAKVEFNQVSKRFAENTVALRDFSLSIEDGEFMVLVGPSGCGKSTALRLLAGLEAVSEGEILIDDQCVNQTTPQQRNIAMVFQNYALYPHMTVRGNLEFPLRMRHIKAEEIESKLSHIAAMLDLTGLLERKPKQLSGGQRQRVAMGRALVRDPSVFLLDEPLSNLDAKLRAQIRADIARLQKQLSKTTLYVTHDQVEAMTLGERVAVMHAGELQQVGSPESLYQAPQNIFVAKFIGSPGMNVIPSTLLNTAEGLGVRLGKQSLPLIHTGQQPSLDISDYIGQPIFLGIRPEALHPTALPGRVGIGINIRATEYLGHESLLYFTLPPAIDNQAENVMIARFTTPLQQPDKTHASLYIDPNAIYLFNQAGHLIHLATRSD